MKLLLYLLLSSSLSSPQSHELSQGDTLFVFFLNQYDDDSIKVSIPGKMPDTVKLKTIESLGACKHGLVYVDNLEGKEISFENIKKRVASSVAIKGGYQYLYVYFLGSNFEFRFEKKPIPLE